MEKQEKKYIIDEIMNIAYMISTEMLCREGAVSKLYQLANGLRDELKEDAQK